MASQISHIIYAKNYLEKYPSREIDRDLFFLGCVFPDIRRVDESIERGETHQAFKNVDLDFSGLDSFQAGWKFHAYSDMRREELLRNWGFYDNDRKYIEWGGPAKLLEDELVYEEYKNWEKIVALFNNPPKIDTVVVSDESMRLWFSILAKYMEKKPNDRARHIFCVKQPSLEPYADLVNKVVTEMKKDAKIVETLRRVNKEIV